MTLYKLQILDEEEAERSGEAKVLDWLEEARLEVDR